jgi:hypothetical protein
LPASDAGYNWIAAQTFYVAQAGTYDFDFPGAGDNQMSFYIDGSLSYADPIHPTITGGTQIGSMIDDLSQLSDFTGETTLTAGDHTAYVVLTDFGGQTGALIGQSTFEPASVPEPSTYALVGLALSGLALVRRRQNKGN